MIDMSEYAFGAVRLAEEKKWNTTFPWLATKLTIELGEFLKAIEEGKPQKFILMEWADVTFVLSQLMYNSYPKGDLDKALKVIMLMNANMEKKTWNGDKVVRR